jgi:hypothetical protein
VCVFGSGGLQAQGRSEVKACDRVVVGLGEGPQEPVEHGLQGT